MPALVIAALTGAVATYLTPGGSALGSLADYVGAFVWGSTSPALLDLAQRAVRAIRNPMGAIAIGGRS